MKRAEDFCKELKWTFDSDPGRYDLFKGLIEPIVKLVQEDAIRETVNMCADNVILAIDGIAEKSNGQNYFVDEGNHYCETMINVDMQSILQVADKLIKEL
jgi:hypothetical protein